MGLSVGENLSATLKSVLTAYLQTFACAEQQETGVAFMQVPPEVRQQHSALFQLSVGTSVLLVVCLVPHVSHSCDFCW